MLLKKMIFLGEPWERMYFPRLSMSLGAMYFADDDAGGGGGSEADAEKEAAAKKAAEDAKWDRDRQHRDELNAAKKRQDESDNALSDANAELEAASTKLAEMEAEKQLLKEQADKAAAEADDADVEKGLLDYENMITEVTAQRKLTADLNEKVEAQAAEIAANRKANEAQAARAENEARDQEGMVIINKLCAEIEKDKKYSAGDRNEVLEATNEAFKAGNISSLGDEARHAWIKDHLRLGYIDAAEERAKGGSSVSTDKNKKKAPRTDPGAGGDPPTDEIKPGDGPFVKKQMMAAAKRRMAAGE